MNSDNTDRLFREFPQLFKRDLLNYGFECEDGWYNLIAALALKIVNHINQDNLLGKLEVLQVKQKFGMLRFYVEGDDEVIRKLINDTEKASQSVCELDGQPADDLYICKPRWFRRLCESCAMNHNVVTVEEFKRQFAGRQSVHELIKDSGGGECK